MSLVAVVNYMVFMSQLAPSTQWVEQPQQQQQHPTPEANSEPHRSHFRPSDDGDDTEGDDGDDGGSPWVNPADSRGRQHVATNETDTNANQKEDGAGGKKQPAKSKGMRSPALVILAHNRLDYLTDVLESVMRLEEVTQFSVYVSCDDPATWSQLDNVSRHCKRIDLQMVWHVC